MEVFPVHVGELLNVIKTLLWLGCLKLFLCFWLALSLTVRPARPAVAIQLRQVMEKTWYDRATVRFIENINLPRAAAGQQPIAF